MVNIEVKENKLLKKEGLYLKIKTVISMFLILIMIGIAGYFLWVNMGRLPNGVM